MKSRNFTHVALVAGSLALGAAIMAVAQDKPAAPAAAPAAAPQVDPNKVVITMGDAKLTVADFEAFLGCLPPEVRGSVKSPAGKRSLADELIRLKLLANEARLRKLDETVQFRQQMDVMRDNLLVGLLLQDLQDDLVNADEIKKYYDDNQAKFEIVTARHILVSTTGEKPLSDEAAKAKAGAIKKRLANGEDFAAIAKAESDDPTKEEGGMLKPFGHGVMVPEFEQAAFTLKADEISEPVHTQFGFHIIQVKKKDVPPLDQIKDAIANQIRQEKFETMYGELKKAVNPQFDADFFPPIPAPAAEKPAEK